MFNPLIQTLLSFLLRSDGGPFETPAFQSVPLCSNIHKSYELSKSQHCMESYMANDSNQSKCDICGGKGTAQIVLQAGPNPCVSPPINCPECNGGDWELWESLMPSGWNRGRW